MCNLKNIDYSDMIKKQKKQTKQNNKIVENIANKLVIRV